MMTTVKLFFVAALCCAGTVRAQIFEANYGNGTVGEYDFNGTPINGSLISGLSSPVGIASDGNGHLFVVNSGSGTIGEYTTSGQTVNASLVSGLNFPQGIALDGQGDLFVVASYGSHGTIGEYTTSGVTLNDSLITGLAYPTGLAFGGGNLFVAILSGSVGEYTSSGAEVNASLIGGLNEPIGLALDGNGHLFVGQNGGGVIGEYNLDGTPLNAALISVPYPDGLALDGYGQLYVSTADDAIGLYTTSGDTINSSFIPGLDIPKEIAIAVPEPSGTVLSIMGAAILAAKYKIRRQLQDGAAALP